MVRVLCENCEKNIMGKMGFEILTGKVDIDDGGAAMPHGCETPSGMKDDGLFCSLKCMQVWLSKNQRLKA